MDNNIDEDTIKEEQEEVKEDQVDTSEEEHVDVPNEEHVDTPEEENNIDEDEPNEYDNYQDFSDDDSKSGFSLGGSNKELIRKIGLLMGGIIAVFIVGGLIMGLISLIKGHSYTYEEVEDIMKDAAVDYFKDHKKSLPKDKQVVEITDSTLIKREYMDDFDEYFGEDNSCSGRVVVRKIDGKYVYIPFLNCGSDYNSTELSSLLKEKIVTTGEGLYSVGDSYIFRGEKVKNYVKLGKKLWRVVKITPDNEIMIVLDSFYEQPNVWDDRYNVTEQYNSGVNNYKLSRMRDYLKTIYKDKDPGTRILTSSDKAKLTEFDLCIGKRHKPSTDKKNIEECKEVLSDQKIGLLTVSDYIFVSLDPNCKKDLDEACQNYNYLATDDDWALTTAVISSNTKVFFVKGGDIDTSEAVEYLEVRPVVMLNDMAMVKKGKGTRKKPYVIK